MSIRRICILLLFSIPLSNVVSAEDIEAGPIWNNDDAKVKCPKTCADNKKEWNGNWVTTKWNVMSVCNCVVPIKPEEEAAPVVVPKPAPPPVEKPHEHAGAEDPCKLTCHHQHGVNFTGESVFSPRHNKQVCRCYLDPARARGLGK